MGDGTCRGPLLTGSEWFNNRLLGRGSAVVDFHSTNTPAVVYMVTTVLSLNAKQVRESRYWPL